MGAECSVPCAVNNRFSAEIEPREQDAGRAGKDGGNWFERKGRSVVRLALRSARDCGLA